MTRLPPYSVVAALLLALAGCSRPPGQWEFGRGLRELERGRYPQARVLLEQSIARRPGHAANPAAYNFLGVACWRMGQGDAARAAFEDSRRLDPRQGDAAYNLAVLAAEGGDPEGAMRLLKESATLQPQQTRALAFAAHLQARQGQWALARRSLHGALARAPESAALHTALGQVEWGAGDTNAALGSLMKALEFNAVHPPALYNLAVVHQQMGQPREAAAYYRKFIDHVPAEEPRLALARAALRALETVPAPAPARVETNAAAAPAGVTAPPAGPTAAGPEDVLKRAQILADKGKGALALELCLQVAEQARAAGRTELQEKALRAATKMCFDQPRAHAALGQFLTGQKKNAEAIKSFKQAVVLDADFTPAQLGMAQAALALGEYDTALVGLKDAVRADPRNADALWALAQLYDRSLDLPEPAARTYADFAGRFPRDPRATGARQRAQELAPALALPPYQAPPSEASEIVVTARTASVSTPAPTPAPAPAPAPPTARIQYRVPESRNLRDAVQALNRGRLYQEQDNLDQAIYYYLRSLENDDTVAATFYYLATAHRTKGELDLAKDGFLRALQLDPKFTNARYHLALVYREQRDERSARTLLQEVVKEKPDYAAAHYVLGYLYAGDPATHADARRHYETFLRLAPQDPAAASVRRWLQSPR